MNKSSPAPLDIKFARIKAVSFVLHPAPQQDLLDALRKRLGPFPGVYSAEPAMLDFSGWSHADFNQNPVDLQALADLLKKAGVHLVEVRAADDTLESQAEALGVRLESSLTAEHPDPPAPFANAPVEANQAQAEPAGEAQQAVLPEHAEPAVPHPEVPEFDNSRRTLVIDHAVRSGQKIYAQGADLIIMGQVSAGAEVIADGNVHVYGVLRGRALAGAAGDTQARIMSTCFEAELVAVAGYYQTFEGGFPEDNRSKPTLIHLDHGSEPPVLRLKAINIR